MFGFDPSSKTISVYNDNLAASGAYILEIKGKIPILA